jgi:drug/metabolite transporter (DMT)-like permease
MSLAPAPAPGTAAHSAALHPRAFFTLLLLACVFGANHVAARVAFNHGVDVATAVAVRSLGTAIVVALIVRWVGIPVRLDARQWRVLALIGVLITGQSLSLYSAVARLPVALALLAFNTFPLWIALWSRLFYGQRPTRAVLAAMPVILLGLALALDVAGAASGLGAAAHWSAIGGGVGFAVAAAALFGLAMVITQHEVAAVDGRLRTAITMGIVGVVALIATQVQGGAQWPQGEGAVAGWWGLLLLAVLYGTGFTVMFTLLPKLGVAGNSPILNVEPVAALVMAWALLGQTIAPVQVAGSLLVVGAVMALGLRR